MIDIYNRLIDKSIEAFIMGLEIYNKPTIKYRIEGFSFFICNAWELMLKAHLIDKYGESSIYYPNSNKTISLLDTVSKIYTDIRQPLRKNIEEIIKLRNTATHFITEDDEALYAPFFQSNVFNFSEQLKRFHNRKITDYVPQNFLTLSINVRTLTDDELKNKYSLNTALNMISRRNDIETLKNTTSSNDLYIPMRLDLYQTKKEELADVKYAIDNNADESVRIVKQEIDPANKYKLTRKQVIDGINKQIKAKDIKFNYTSAKGSNDFNEYTLKIIDNYYDISSKYSYTFVNSKRYSQQFIDEIINIISANADVIEQIKKR